MVDYPTAQLHLPGRLGVPRTLLLLALASGLGVTAAVLLTRRHHDRSAPHADR
jgi:hypothetical protein